MVLEARCRSPPLWGSKTRCPGPCGRGGLTGGLWLGWLRGIAGVIRWEPSFEDWPTTPPEGSSAPPGPRCAPSALDPRLLRCCCCFGAQTGSPPCPEPATGLSWRWSRATGGGRRPGAGTRASWAGQEGLVDGVWTSDGVLSDLGHLSWSWQRDQLVHSFTIREVCVFIFQQRGSHPPRPGQELPPQQGAWQL